MWWHRRSRLRRNSCRCFGCGSDEAACFVCEVPDRHREDVDEPPDKEEAKGEEEQDAGEDFAGVEAVYSEEAQEDGQNKRGWVVFDAQRIRHKMSIKQLFRFNQVFLIK